MKRAARLLAAVLPLLLAPGCADVNTPGGRSISVPTISPPLDRYRGLNEQRDAVTRVRLGKDVLVPQRSDRDPLPEDEIGPFELRGETLASALQLALDDYDISLAFESDLAMTTRISVANLKGRVANVVDRMCEMANLYCTYKDGVLTVKETETFLVDLPPIVTTASSAGSSSSSSAPSSGAAGSSASGGSGGSGSTTNSFEEISSGLAAVLGTAPNIDATTRVMIYTATQRSQKNALKYFERLRKNTALIVYETHIWEVTLDNENRAGIDWSLLYNKGNFGLDIQFPGGAPDGSATPISITPTYTGSSTITPAAVLDFISQHGAVKTVSQPQLTVLSGSNASLVVRQAENFVSGVTRTPSTVVGQPDTVSTTTQTVETGLAMSVSSAWDQSTVYGAITITIEDLLGIDEFEIDPSTGSTIQLPRTTERGLQTLVRVRPGDAILIGGLVTQKDNYTASGPGFMKPLFSSARRAVTTNTELVFLLRPRVVAFVPGDEEDTVPVAYAPGSAAPSVAAGKKAGAGDDGEENNPSPLPAGISPAALVPEGRKEEAAPGIGAAEKGAGGEFAPLDGMAVDMAPVPLMAPVAPPPAERDRKDTDGGAKP